MQAVLTLVLVMSLSFFLIRALPGGPEDYLQQRLLSDPTIGPSEMQYIMEQYFNYIPDAPLHEQFINYVVSLLHGDLGTSVFYQKPVIDIIANGMPWTIYISAVTLFVSWTSGIIMGSIMAYKEGGKFDVGTTLYMIVMDALPFYLFALVLLWIFSFTLGWFPIGGRFGSGPEPGLNPEFVATILYHSFLPIMSLFIVGFGGAALGMRANSIQVLGKDYTRVARLRGLTDSRIALRYVGWNALLPLYTGLMISIGSLFGGSVILEKIFNYRGMGFFLFRSVATRDYPLMLGGFLFITAGVIFGIYLADLTYGFIDPRAGTGDEREAYAGRSPVRSVVRWLRGLRQSIPNLVRRVIGAFDTDSSHERRRANGMGVDATRAKPGTDSPFGTVSGVEVSRIDDLSRRIDRSVLAPLRVMWNDWRARVGGLIILGYILMGTVGVALTDPPQALSHPTLTGPFQDLAYPLGTNDMGKSLLHQVIHATPAMFKMIIGGAVWGTSMAAFWGIFSGFAGGKVDRAMMAFADVLMTLPGLPLIIIISAFIQPEDPFVVGFILTINGWAGGSRTLRSQVLTLREDSYVEASRALGVSNIGILVRDILPNLMPLILLRFVTLSRSVINSSVGLYFLGILPFTTLNWGVMLNLAYGSGTWYNMDTIYWILVPMFTIMLLSIGFILFGQSMDRVFNPRIRARHAKTTPDAETQEIDSAT